MGPVVDASLARRDGRTPEAVRWLLRLAALFAVLGLALAWVPAALQAGNSPKDADATALAEIQQSGQAASDALARWLAGQAGTIETKAYLTAAVEAATADLPPGTLIVVPREYIAVLQSLRALVATASPAAASLQKLSLDEWLAGSPELFYAPPPQSISPAWAVAALILAGSFAAGALLVWLVTRSPDYVPASDSELALSKAAGSALSVWSADHTLLSAMAYGSSPLEAGLYDALASSQRLEEFLKTRISEEDLPKLVEAFALVLQGQEQHLVVSSPQQHYPHQVTLLPTKVKSKPAVAMRMTLEDEKGAQATPVLSSHAASLLPAAFALVNSATSQVLAASDELVHLLRLPVLSGSELAGRPVNEIFNVPGAQDPESIARLLEDPQASAALLPWGPEGRLPLEQQVIPLEGTGTVLWLFKSADSTPPPNLDRRRDGDLRLHEFATAASHRLRTPLSVLLGYADLLPEAAENPQLLEEAVEGVASATTRLAEVVDDLLAMADPSVPLDLRPVRVDDLAQAVTLGVSQECPTLVMTWAIPSTLSDEVVHVDSVMLARALSSLLSAERLSRPFSSVSASVDESRGFLSLRLLTGPTTPWPSSSVDTVPASLITLSFGASFAQRIAAAHGGTLEVSVDSEGQVAVLLVLPHSKAEDTGMPAGEG